ncbi:ankyrin repeat domain-containing protein [uncultured Paracoccus sp.]|uniref:ankyrin repeat domain-containing protein n=1 Tax=uncultured Paracoccus sp. TaxID=189685 RepID=UPI00261194B8|nr:ankyrin repeat domain-containing protein [uncultured Paracoccus sp.]
MRDALALVLLMLAAEAAGQPATPVCEALSQQLAQSPAALEGRVLNETLFEAAALDCAEIASAMLARGASVAARDRSGGTALSVAADAGAEQVATLLLSHGADVEHRNLEGSTPLLSAALAGRRRMVDLLVQAGADPGPPNLQGVTPVMAAAFEGDLRMLKPLLAAGADPRAVDSQGKGALVYAAGRAFPPIVTALLNAGVAADQIFGHDLTALMWVAGHANDAPQDDGVEVARMLVKAGVGIDRQDDRGRTALMIAAERGHAAMVGFLVEAGADPHLRDSDGLRAADLAADEIVLVQAAVRSPALTIDLYKGVRGSFRDWDGQLRQPVLLATANAVIAIAPIDGFEHRTDVLDSLGLDRTETDCSR